MDVLDAKLATLSKDLAEKFEKKIDSALARIMTHLHIGYEKTIQNSEKGIDSGNKGESSKTEKHKALDISSFVHNGDIPT